MSHAPSHFETSSRPNRRWSTSSSSAHTHIPFWSDYQTRGCNTPSRGSRTWWSKTSKVSSCWVWAPKERMMPWKLWIQRLLWSSGGGKLQNLSTKLLCRNSLAKGNGLGSQQNGKLLAAVFDIRYFLPREIFYLCWSRSLLRFDYPGQIWYLLPKGREGK